MADAKDTQEKGLHVQETSSSQSGSTHSDAASNENKDMEKGAGTDNEASIATKDPDAVDWDGPDDPANPRNWTRAQKMANIVLVSLSVLYCNLATTMFSPGANIMQKEFGFTNTTVEIMTITISSLGFGLGQMFAGPASEVFGRLPIYRTCAIFYLGFTAGCSQSTTVAEFIVFRLLAGMAASPFMTTGGGTIADILPKEERGAAMAIFSAGPLFGPVRHPVTSLNIQKADIAAGYRSYRRWIYNSVPGLEVDILHHHDAGKHAPPFFPTVLFARFPDELHFKTMLTSCDIVTRPVSSRSLATL